MRGVMATGGEMASMAALGGMASLMRGEMASLMLGEMAAMAAPGAQRQRALWPPSFRRPSAMRWGMPLPPSSASASASACGRARRQRRRRGSASTSVSAARRLPRPSESVSAGRRPQMLSASASPLPPPLLRAPSCLRGGPRMRAPSPGRRRCLRCAQ